MQRAWKNGLLSMRGFLARLFRAPCVVKNALRQKIIRHRLAILAAAVLVCLYAGGVLSYVWLISPDIGVRCAFTPVINHFDREFFVAGEAPEGDDTITQLGAQNIANWAQVLHELAALRREKAETGTEADLLADSRPTHLLVNGEEVVRVRYRKAEDGTIGTVWLRVGQPPLQTLLPSILWFALKIVLFAVGAYVFWKRPEDRSAAAFFVFCLVSFGAYMGGYHWSRIATQPALILVFMVCVVLLPVVSLHFYLVFPRPKAILDRAPQRVRLVLYGPPLLFLLLFVSGYFRIRGWFYQPDSVPIVTRLLNEMLFEIYCYFGVAALWYLASAVCLIHSYRNAVATTERNQVKWILYGTLASLAPIGYSLYLALAQRQRFGGGAATWPMFFASVCVTVAFTISITRYRLMQLDQLIGSGLRYFLFSSGVGLVYYGLVFGGMVLLGSIEGPTFGGQVVAASGTALIFLIGLNLFRDRFTAALNRHFRREKHQLDRMLQRMSQAIEQLVDAPALARRLLQTSVELLGGGGGAVFLRQGDAPLYRLVESLGPVPALSELSSGCPLVESLIRCPQSAVLSPANAPADGGQRQLHFLGGVVAQALVHEGQLHGILLLAAPAEPRGSDADKNGGYSAEDLHLLAAFAQMSVLALVSAEGYRKIDVLNHELQSKIEKIAEQQRRILALQSQLSAVRHPPSALDGQTAVDSGQRAADSGQRKGVIGSSVQVHQLMQLVRKVAVTDSVVLLRGESGTGKELLARAIHDNSPRADKPFVAVHCSALSPSLLESELFGHVKGAFTGAIRDKVGRFEAADGGTLFLDEIGDIALEVQIKLLRVLQERVFERVGSSEPFKVDVRIITATHQVLETLMRQGRFREDLFFRLDVFSIALPALRDRIEDVPELALHFLRLYSQRINKPMAGIDDDALMRLKAYSWPGNVRQLENVIQRAVVVAEKPVITIEELPAELHADLFAAAVRTQRPLDSGEETLEETVFDPWPSLTSAAPPGWTAAIEGERANREQRECAKFVRALAEAGGNKSEAARALGMARSTFISRLKRLGLT